jgi:hypothetical protein
MRPPWPASSANGWPNKRSGPWPNWLSRKTLQLLSAMTHHLRLTLDQVAIEEKSNEIPALKPLLKKLHLPPGVLITGDAMHCQQESARFITQELGGDYLFGLKGNQSGILDRAQRLLAQQAFSPSGPVGEGTRPA